LVLSGAGRGFCAGQDLGDRAVAPGTEGVDLGESLENRYNPLVLTLHNLPMPVIAAVNGVAAGAGANIALACDIVVAARSASFVQAFSKLGLIPDSGGTWILPRLVGSARAMGLALLGNKLPAEQAAAWGMIWQCVETRSSPAPSMRWRCNCRGTDAGLARPRPHCGAAGGTHSPSNSISNAIRSAILGIRAITPKAWRRSPRSARPASAAADMNLQSYVCGHWQSGSGQGVAMRDATTGEPVATASSAGIDFAAVLATPARWAVLRFVS